MRAKKQIIEIIGEPTLFGAAQHFLTLVSGLDKKKYEIVCIAPPGPLASKLREIKGIKTETVPMRSRFDFKSVKKIRKIISRLRQDYGGQAKLIVHCHGVRAGWLGRLSCISVRKKASYVIYTEHLWTAEYRLKSPILQFLQLMGLWFLDLFTNKTIAVSCAVADFLVRRKITRPDKIAVIYNGIETKLKAQSSKLKTAVKNSKLTLGFVGSLTERKGVEYLIRAFAELLSSKLPISKLIIAGEGPEENKLKKLAKKLKVEKKIEFRGFVDDPAEVFRETDIYLQPSRDEAFGIAVLQALSCGVPVIASCVGGLPEVMGAKSIKDSYREIIKTEVGFLVPSSNYKAITDAVLKAVRRPADLLKMSRAAEKRARVFSADKMVKETEIIYNQAS